MRFFLFLLTVFFLPVYSVQAQTAPLATPPVAVPQSSDQTLELSMITSNSILNTLPSEIFAGKKFETEPGSTYTKLHLYSDQSFYLSRFQIEFCDSSQASNTHLTYYINFDEYSDQIRRKSQVVDAFPSKDGVRSLTFNFENNPGVCIQSIQLFGKNGLVYKTHTSKFISGTVSASSTLSPQTAYDALNLFDSRFEYAWSSKGKSVGENLQFNFVDTVTINKIKFWNGYQRSPVHCVSNSRPKTISLTGDGGYSATITVKDALEPQTVDLPQAFTGKSLKMTVTEAYPGKKYPDLVISELRFYDGKDWFGLDPMQAIKNTIQENKTHFAKAGLQGILNQSLNGYETVSTQNGSWIFRFRADGSLYLEGFADAKKSSVSYFGVGNFEVKETTPTQIKVRIFGVLRKTKYPYGGDCNGCGQDCNKLDTLSASGSDETKTEQIFQDYLWLSKKSDETFVIENKETVKQIKLTKVEANFQ